MKITDISLQAKNKDRVNISVDGKYRFSLDVFQVGELGIKIGREFTNDELTHFEQESEFGKLYARALEYCLMRPHSAKEVRDYLWRKTRPSLKKDGTKKPGVSQDATTRVFERLQEKGYINDERFAEYWITHRNQTKGSSKRKLINELRVKGVATGIIEKVYTTTERDESADLKKVIAKKSQKYSDPQKLMAYLMRQGFRYDDIKTALAED